MPARKCRCLTLVMVFMLAGGTAPTAFAGAPAGPFEWWSALQSLGAWWTDFAGAEPELVGRATSEVAPRIDPNGAEVSPHIDPDGAEVAPRLDPNGADVSPHIDPNG